MQGLTSTGRLAWGGGLRAPHSVSSARTVTSLESLRPSMPVRGKIRVSPSLEGIWEASTHLLDQLLYLRAPTLHLRDIAHAAGRRHAQLAYGKGDGHHDPGQPSIATFLKMLN